MFPVGLGLKYCLEVLFSLLTFGLFCLFGAFAKECVGTIFCISYLLLCKNIQNPVMSMEKPNPTVYCISTTLTQAKPIGQPMTKISIRGRKVT
jgi:hypothetical protein